MNRRKKIKLNQIENGNNLFFFATTATSCIYVIYDGNKEIENKIK